METEEKFNQIYQAIIKENAEDMEGERKDAQREKKYNIFVWSIIIVINIVIYLFVYNVFQHGNDVLAAGLAVGLVVISIVISLMIVIKFEPYGNSKREKYTMDFKTRVVGIMIKSFGEQLEFNPQGRIISIRI